MILQLFSLLNANSNIYIALEIITLFIKEKVLKFSRKLKKKLCILISKKRLKLDKKKKKPGDLINKKQSKLDEKIKKKNNHLLFCSYLLLYKYLLYKK